MVGKEDAPSGGSRAPCQSSASSRKMFWRSASWSASRSSLHNPENDEKELADPNNGGIGNGNGQNRRFPAPLTPRSQQNCKGRSCLPPLQPLSIARRSLDEWPKASSDDIGEWPQPPTPSGRGCGERLKLDLSSIQRNHPDKNGGLVRRDKIAFFDKECSKVAEHIYLGGDAVARDREILKQNGITHILNCVGFVCPEYFKADFVYRTLWLQDSPSEDITSILYDVFDYFEDVREQRGRVFVHCCQGVSRSTSLVIAYLMWREGQSFDDAFQYVKAARGIADPNMGFACQLLQCQKRVHAFPLSPSSLLRMYRLAPHSPYDPLHLVPKMLNDPSPAALDSRGAFIVHIPSAIYVWIGKSCEAIMERDARGAVCQIVRYERVQGPITVFKEGDEPACFWDAFSNLLPLMDKSGNGKEVRESIVKICPGERKVESFNVDFEIFQKAIMGGFVPPFASSENEHETHLPARESSWSVLRRKFASGNMKDFVYAPRISLSRVYSDSMMLVHLSKNSSPPLSLSSSLSSASSSSSSSPPYLSPDSISSEPSTSSKYSESSCDSPSAASGSFISSVSSSFSNLSLRSLKSLSQPTPESPETGCASFASQSNSLSFKKPLPSLAERRGSLSKSLKLPVLADKMRITPVFSSFPVNQEEGPNTSNSSCFLADDIDNGLKSKDGVENGGRESSLQCKIFPARNTSVNTSQAKAAFVKQFGDAWREGQESSVPNGLEESGLSGRDVTSQSNSLPLPSLTPPVVCRWPSLETVTKVGANDLDSKAAFAILSPNTGLGKNEESILYLWIGRAADRGKCQIRLDSGKELDVLEELDWNQVGSDVLTQLGLPENTTIKEDSGFVPLFVYAIFGSSRQLAVGPVALVSLLVSNVLSGIVDPSDDLYTEMAILLALMVGILECVMGLLRLGWLIRFISHSVISGFTTASAIVIALSQAKYFLGYDITRSSKIIPLVKSVIEGAHGFLWPPFVMGSIILAILLVMKHLGKSRKYLRFLRAAGPLTGVVVGTTFVKIFHPSSISLVGDIPQGLPKFSIPKGFGYITSLIPTALLITGVAILESVGIAKALAAKNGYELDSNQELFGLGVANVFGSFFSAYPSTGSFSRSAVSHESGAKTGLSGIVTGIIMGSALLFLTPLFKYIPQCALAAIVISAVMGLVDYEEAIFLWRVDKKDFLLWTITATTTLFLGIEFGVLIGVGASLAFVIHESANPHIAVLGRLPGTTVYRNVRQYPEAYTYNGIVIVRVDAPIYFANISYIKDRLRDYEADVDRCSRRGPEVERIYFVILEMSPVTYIDSSAVQALKDLHQEYKMRDIQIAISNPNREVLLTLSRAGVVEMIGKEWYFVRVHDAVQVCLQYVQGLKETRRTADPVIGEKPSFIQRLLKQRAEDSSIVQLESGNLRSPASEDNDPQLEPLLSRKA